MSIGLNETELGLAIIFFGMLVCGCRLFLQEFKGRSFSLDIFFFVLFEPSDKSLFTLFFGFKYTLGAKLLRLILDNGLIELLESESENYFGLRYFRDYWIYLRSFIRISKHKRCL